MATKPSPIKEQHGKAIEELLAKAGSSPESLITQESYLGDKFKDLMDEREELAATITDLEAEKDKLSLRIATALVKRGYLGADGNGRVVRVMKVVRHGLDKAQLLENGVSASTIAKSSTASTSYSLRVDKAS